MKWKVKVSSAVTIFKATKSIIFSGGASSTLDNWLLQNRVVGVDLVIDVDVGIDADIDRDVDAGRNDEIGRDVDVYLCSVAEEEKLRLQLARSLIPGFHKINDNSAIL